MNRRDFFRVVTLSAFAAQFGKIDRLFADSTVPLDPNIVAIFSDIHLRNPETIQAVVRFNQCVAQVLAMNPRPAQLLIYGDLAYNAGTVEDYTLFKKLIKPIEDAGIAWQAAMGNHDRLNTFREVFPERVAAAEPLENRYVNIVETPKADFILLDSYLEGQVRGEITQEQRDWLEEAVKRYDEKPFFVGCHHPLNETGLVEVLKAQPKFAAFLHGHNHFYRSPVQEAVQTLCFPSTGLWGDLGFVIANLTDEEATFAPRIDAYQWPKWSKEKDPVEDVDAWIARLNANSPVIKLPR